MDGGQASAITHDNVLWGRTTVRVSRKAHRPCYPQSHAAAAYLKHLGEYRGNARGPVIMDSLPEEVGAREAIPGHQQKE